LGRIADAFTTLKRDGKKGFIPYITAGDPDLATTEQLLVTLAQHATLIELGVPFSDPMADGPVIQRASERALKNSFGLQDILDTAARARKQIETPIILFSYYNPLLQFGLKRVAEAAKNAGVDGVLVTDLTPEESGEFEAELRAHDLEPHLGPLRIGLLEPVRLPLDHGQEPAQLSLLRILLRRLEGLLELFFARLALAP